MTYRIPFLILLSQITAVSAAPTERPNILFVMTDQQHAGMMSCADNPWVSTAAMDSLAKTGVRFERAYCANPVCMPSRVAMITGRMPSVFGMHSNQNAKIPDEVRKTSLGHIFRDAGYETAYGGKVHLPGRIESYGFDVISSDQRDQLSEDCAEFLSRRHDQPFLLVASFINPHDICYMAINDHSRAMGRPLRKNEAQEYLTEAMKRPPGVSEEVFFERLCPPLPPNHDLPQDAPDALRPPYPGFRDFAFENWDQRQWRLHRWTYARLTEQVDRQIGVVLRALREAGLEQDTLVVFTSDHGDLDGAHRLEHKSFFYEEAARVPFIVSWKGITKPGYVNRSHTVSTGLDVIPTLCDFAGIQPPTELRGLSVRALSQGREPGVWRQSVISETKQGRMICSGRFKYSVYDGGEQREFLVDLESDPGEMKNLASDSAHAKQLNRHRELLQRWVIETGDQLARPYVIPPSSQKPRDAAGKHNSW